MQIEIEKIARCPSRTGRDLQRYNLDRRQVVGCIPYRFQSRCGCSSSVVDELEVLLISSQKSDKMMFPKGGWESDESMEEAVRREAVEEAGVTGIIQQELGKWSYKSKSQDKMHDGYMFPLFFGEELEEWPEKDVRKRKWATVEEAKRLCPQWMNEALDALIDRLEQERSSSKTEGFSPSSSTTTSPSSSSTSSSSASSLASSPEHFLGTSALPSSLQSSSSIPSSSSSPCSYEAEVLPQRKKMRTQMGSIRTPIPA